MRVQGLIPSTRVGLIRKLYHAKFKVVIFSRLKFDQVKLEEAHVISPKSLVTHYVTMSIIASR